MAARRGYRPARDYDPRRGKKRGAAGGRDAAGGRGASGGRGGEHSAEGTAPSSSNPKKAPQNRDLRAANDDFVAPSSQRRGKNSGDKHPDGSNTGGKNVDGERWAHSAPLAAPLPAPLEATQTAADDVAGLTFAELGLGGNIVRALAELGASVPFAIQAVTIPDALAGHHVLGRARTGSGKTIAFGAAVVERLLRLKAEGAFAAEGPRERPKRGERQLRPARGEGRAPKALILAPTRELALQIDRTVQPIARAVGLFTGQFVGGQPFEPQLHALKRGVDIAIGTPGRIEDLSKRGHLALGQIAITVIDEADHMAELGFIEAVQRILRQTRRGGQRLLFSATLDTAVDELVREFMPRPAMHEVIEGGDDDQLAGSGSTFGADWRPAANVQHRVLIVMREHKDAALLELVHGGGRTIVFCRTRAYADRVAEMLGEARVPAIALHGDLSQTRRERNLERFTSGKADVLVATDVAARGIHIDDVDLVLQADPPDDPKAYVHRAGRTGRVGRAGRVLTLIPRTRQKRTRELFAALGFEPAFFGDFTPEGAEPPGAASTRR